MSRIIKRVIVGYRYSEEIGKDVPIERSILECRCGNEITLYGFTNTCDICEADYNMCGQILAPRSQWGEETGESVSDILSVDNDREDY